MSIQTFQQKILLVAEPTNCNDIYKSIINEASKYNVNTDGLEKEKYPKLDDIGIKETFLLMRNEPIWNLLGLNAPDKINPHILTVLETPAIEMALILYNENSTAFNIYPVPFLSAASGVYNTASLDKLKEVFGGKYNSKKYWERRELSPNIDRYSTTLKSKVPTLNWTFTNDKIKFVNLTSSGIKKNVNKVISRGSLSGFMFSKFLDNILYPLIRETIINENYGSLPTIMNYNNENAKQLKPIVMVSNFDTIRSFLDQVKSKKYNPRDYKIERSSIWEIEVKVTKKIENGKINFYYEYINHSKRYPTEFVSKNLLLDDNIFKIKFRGKQFEVIDLSKQIPITSVINMDCKHCKESKKMIKILKEIAEKIKEKNNKNKSKNNGSIIKTNKNNTKFIRNVRNFEEAVDVLTEE